MNNEHWDDSPPFRNLIKVRKVPNVSSKTLKGRNICITGTLETFYRDELIKIIKSKGGKYNYKIGPKTNVLLVGTWYPNEHWTAPPHKWNYWNKYKMKNAGAWDSKRSNILLKGESDFINFLIHEDKKIEKDKKGYKMIIIIFFFFLYYFRFSFVYLQKINQPQPFLLKM